MCTPESGRRLRLNCRPGLHKPGTVKDKGDSLIQSIRHREPPSQVEKYVILSIDGALEPFVYTPKDVVHKVHRGGRQAGAPADLLEKNAKVQTRVSVPHKL